VVTRTRAEPDGRRRRPTADLGRRLTPAGDFAHGRTGAAGTVASTRSSTAAGGGRPAAGLGRRLAPAGDFARAHRRHRHGGQHQAEPGRRRRSTSCRPGPALGAGRGFRARAPVPPARWPAPGRARPPAAVDQQQVWAGARRRQGISRARTGATGTVASTRQSPAAGGGRPAAGLGRRQAPAEDFARAHRCHRHGGQHQAEPGRRRRSTSCRPGPALGAGRGFRARTGATGTVASTRQSPAAGGGRPAAGLGRRQAPDTFRPARAQAPAERLSPRDVVEWHVS